MEDSIFTKIIKGIIPCYKIAEDANFIAFLDVNPLQEGHTLVVPKNQIDYIDWIELIKFKETRNYVQRVLENYNVYRYVLEQQPIAMKDFFKNNTLF